MTFQQLFSELQNRKYRPVYFLMGDESWFIDRITDHLIEHVLKPEEKAFNQLVVYGRDTDILSIINAARKFPMMAERQLIVVREAQHLRNLDALEHYLAAPAQTTLLAFAYKYKKIDKRTRLARLLADKSVLFESDKLREDKVPDWIVEYLREKGYACEMKAAALLVDLLGNDLGKIVMEIEKLMVLLPSGKNQVSSALVEKNIGISKDYNTFELTRAIAYKDHYRAARIAMHFQKNPKNHPFLMVISALFYYFTKVLLVNALKEKSRETVARQLGINPYFAQEYMQAAQHYPYQETCGIISMLREYDLKIKGGSLTNEGELLKELIYKIMH